MHVLSVNVASSFVMVPHGDSSAPTGHFKKPVPGPVMARALGLDGDDQADRVYHGGPHQALYFVSASIGEYWARELGRPPFKPGDFGENLTVEGLADEDVHIGDVFRIGAPRSDGAASPGPLVQVSIPRAPCFKLGFAMGDSEFPRKFLATRRVGFYARVLEEGPISAGDAITLERADPARFSVRDLTDLAFFGRADRAANARAAQLEGLSPEWRERFAGRA